VTSGTSPSLALPVQQVEELVRTLVKAARAFQMYLPNNPMYQRSVQALRDAFNPIWSNVPELTLKVVETDLLWEEQVVYHQPSKTESFAWTLYKDGLRQLTVRPGVEDGEIVQLLETIARARLLAADAGDDLLTLLWERDFGYVDYRFAEVVIDQLAVLDPQAVEMGMGNEIQQQAENHRKVEEEVTTLRPGQVDPDDFDSTLYFLDDTEILTLRRQVDDEYVRDIRQSAFSALLDVFELQPQTAVRDEVLGVLDSIFPNLLTRGEFRPVAWLLREFRAILDRVNVLEPATRERLQGFEAKLSDPTILSQILQLVEESTTLSLDDDVGELLKELRASALEAILTYLPRIKPPGVRAMLEGAAERIARGNLEAVLQILRHPDSPGLTGAIGLCRRLQLQPAVPAVGGLVGHADPAVRLAAVEALGDLGTPGALSLLERALDDEDRAIRLAAVGVVANRGYKGALRRLEAVVAGKGPHELERAEKRQFFEAYAVVAGPAGLSALIEILEPRGLFRRKESPETRTCATYAVAKIRTPEARAALERAANDKELAVRNAASRALREWAE
jgi:hypothetical protein